MKYSEKFISATKEYNTFKHHVAAPLFRREFKAGKCERAEITICGLGFYELFLNGKNITKGVLAPYISNPDQIVFYDTYDLSGIVKADEDNVIGVKLGNGLTNNPGGGIWDFDKASFRAAPKFSLTYEEDGEVVFEADENFLTHPSAIKFDDYRYGLIYDARDEIIGWADVGFKVDETWRTPIEVDAPKGIHRERLAEPIVIKRDIKPVSIHRNRKGYLFDFGENITGIITFNMENSLRGQKLKMEHVEAAYTNNMPIHHNIICGPALFAAWVARKNFCQGITYYCHGGKEDFTSSFTYNGFRFLQVSGLLPTQVKPELFTAHEISSDLPRRSEFTCSSYMLNKLYAAGLNSDMSNFVFFPTDCPHREKNGWTGDAAASAEQFLLNFKSENSLREWLRCIVKAQRDDGALPGIVPTGGWGFKWGNGPSWDTVLFTLTYEIYRITDDKSVILDTADAMEKYLKYIGGRRAANGTVAVGLGDWVEVDRPASNPLTKLAVTDTLQCMNMSRMARDLFKAVGQTERAKYAEAERAEYYEAIRKNFVNEDTKVVSTGTHTAQSMAIVYGVFRKDELEKAGKVLIDSIKQNKGRLRSGLLGTRYAHEALHMVGADDLAYDIITNGDHSSPAFWMNKGSNTLWEHYPDVKTGDNMRFSRKDSYAINSLNHHFLGGGFMAWFFKSVLGIRQNEDLTNPAKVVIEPGFVSSLQHASGEVDFPVGKVAVSWTRGGGHDVTLTVKAAPSIALEIRVPDDVKVIRE